MTAAGDHRKKALVFGAGGKLGSALCKALHGSYRIEGQSSRDLDITRQDQVERALHASEPDVVINAAAFVGIDACEQNPEKAFAANTLFPKLLAALSNRNHYLLVHISSDAVFNGQKHDYYTEADGAQPLNIYGLSKYGGDCLVQAIAQRYYIFRIPLLFGDNPKNNQFVEKMLVKIRQGAAELQISDDIITSPSYSGDIALAIKKIIAADTPHGLYHLANKGRASLFELMRQMVRNLDLKVAVKGCSHVRFPSVGIKNRYTPIRSDYLEPLRPWQEALSAYCAGMDEEVMHG